MLRGAKNTIQGAKMAFGTPFLAPCIGVALRAIMLKMGFATQWVNCMMLCVTTVSYKISVNGELVGPLPLLVYSMSQRTILSHQPGRK